MEIEQLFPFNYVAIILINEKETKKKFREKGIMDLCVLGALFHDGIFITLWRELIPHN